MGHEAACYMAIPGSGHSRAPARMIRKVDAGFRNDHAKKRERTRHDKTHSETDQGDEPKSTGVPVNDDEAARIANSIGPAFEGFAPVSGTLPFDLEPATFLLVQKVSR